MEKKIKIRIGEFPKRETITLSKSTVWFSVFTDDKDDSLLEMSYSFGITSKKKKKKKFSIFEIRKDRLLNIAMDLERMMYFFCRVIRLDLKLNEKYMNDINQSSCLLSLLLLFVPVRGLYVLKQFSRTDLGEIIFSKEDGLFELIKSEGPMILCNPDAQDKIIEFLTDRDNAISKMNKLKDSLLEYGIGPSFVRKKKLGKSELRAKIGRPESDVTKKIGKKGIFIAYKMLTYLFMYSKDIAKDQEVMDVNDFFEKEWKYLLNLLKDRAEEYKLNEFLDSAEGYPILGLNPFYWMSNYINNDKSLKAEFLEFDWEPNKYAKKLLIKILNVSESKLTKTLYGKV